MINKILFFAAIVIFNNIALGNLQKNTNYKFEGYISYGESYRLAIHPSEKKILVNNISDLNGLNLSDKESCYFRFVEYKDKSKYEVELTKLICISKKEDIKIYNVESTSNSMQYDSPRFLNFRTVLLWLYNESFGIPENIQVKGKFTIKRDVHLIPKSRNKSLIEHEGEHFKDEKKSQLQNDHHVCSEIRGGIFTNFNSLLKPDSSLKNIKFDDNETLFLQKNRRLN